MKFMLIRKADERTEKGVMPSECLLQAMADYNERLMQAGVFVTGDGLKPSSEGYLIEFSDGQVRLELRRYFELADFAPSAAIEKHRALGDKLARLPVGVSTHLVFAGHCREALEFYADLMGGQVRAMLPYGDTPMAEQVPASFRDRICHAELVLGAHTIMGADRLPECYQAPAGNEIALQYDDIALGEEVFRALAENGSVRMPFAETFWAQRFGMVVDRFGIGWMVNCGIREDG